MYSITRRLGMGEGGGGKEELVGGRGRVSGPHRVRMAKTVSAMIALLLACWSL